MEEKELSSEDETNPRSQDVHYSLQNPSDNDYYRLPSPLHQPDSRSIVGQGHLDPPENQRFFGDNPIQGSSNPIQYGIYGSGDIPYQDTALDLSLPLNPPENQSADYCTNPIPGRSRETSVIKNPGASSDLSMQGSSNDPIIGQSYDLPDMSGLKIDIVVQKLIEAIVDHKFGVGLAERKGLESSASRERHKTLQDPSSTRNIGFAESNPRSIIYDSRFPERYTLESSTSREHNEKLQHQSSTRNMGFKSPQKSNLKSKYSSRFAEREAFENRESRESHVKLQKTSSTRDDKGFDERNPKYEHDSRFAEMKAFWSRPSRDSHEPVQSSSSTRDVVFAESNPQSKYDSRVAEMKAFWSRPSTSQSRTVTAPKFD